MTYRLPDECSECGSEAILPKSPIPEDTPDANSAECANCGRRMALEPVDEP